MDLDFTGEQLEIIYLEPEKDLLIEAFAGSGKTSTLIEFCNQNFDKKILYLVFNKHMRKYAKFLFPINTSVHTLNSFIYSNMKKFFPNIKITENIDVNFILTYSSIIKKYKTEEAFILAAQVSKKFNTFFSSNTDLKLLDKENNAIDHIIYELYELMYNRKIPISHNVLAYIYINYFFENLEKKYDYILIDEAQDLDLSMLSLVNKFKGRKIFIGDRYQSIYGFRGNYNIFIQESNNFERKYLSKTFRFGENIASFVNSFLERNFNEHRKIIGNKTIKDNVIEKKDLTLNFLKENFDNAYICRTNAYLFEKAIYYAEQGISVAIPYNWEEIKNLLKDTYLLKIGVTSQIENKKIKNYKNYENLIKILELGGDPELYFLTKIIDKYDLNIFDKINILEQKLSNYKYADLILLTGHKSKGLEFDNVIIGDDFYESLKKKKDNLIEEYNLQYVAYTRAKNNLFI